MTPQSLADTFLIYAVVIFAIGLKIGMSIGARHESKRKEYAWALKAIGEESENVGQYSVVRFVEQVLSIKISRTPPSEPNSR